MMFISSHISACVEHRFYYSFCVCFADLGLREAASGLGVVSNLE